ncbi:MAG TPA: hypothetical protein PKI12_07095, partial [Bacteroidales bacterium]|nr:hypothetical protein [Bacteroidales bacterium]
MKKFLVLFIFLSLLLRSYAQDLIITTGGDTIECSIQLVKPDFIYYSIKVNDEFRTVSLPAGNVLSYRYETSEPIVPVPKVRATSYRDFGRLRLSFNTGYGYQLGKIKKDITPDLTEYQEKLKSGYQFGGSFSYFLSKYFGLGVEYRSFRTSNSKDKVRLVDEWGFTEYGTIADNINISLYNFIFTVRASRFPGRDSFYATYG